MRPRIGLILCAALAGASLGGIEAMAWLRGTGAGAGRTEAYPVPAALLTALLAAGVLVAAHLIATRLWPTDRPATALVSAALSLAAGSAIYILFTQVARPTATGPWTSTLLISTGVSLAASLVIWLLLPYGRRRLAIAGGWGLLVLIFWLLAAAAYASAASPDLVPTIGGFAVFDALALRPQLRLEPSPVASAFAGAALGVLVLLIWTGIRRAQMAPSLLRGAVLGSIVSCTLCLSNLMQFAQISGSAASGVVALRSAIGNCTLLGLLYGTSLLVYRRRSLLGFLPAAVYIACACLYLSSVHAGRDLYLAASSTYSYRTSVYLHYSADGSWRRTSDSRSDDLKLVILDRLIARYPRSMYRPQAMYDRAVSAYDAWRFEEAVATLAKLHSEYPGATGPSRVLHYLALLASGRPADAAHMAQTDEQGFQSWLCSEGSRLAAIPYADLGLRARATGLYSRYLDHLFSEYQGKWVSSAAAGTEGAITDLQQALDDGKPQVGQVTGSIDSRESAAGIRIALVKPQLDISSLADSRQFTGARTLPLWNGRSVQADARGRFVIRNVPYGTYDVVVAFDAARAPMRSVLAPVGGAVVVDRPRVAMPSLRFVDKVVLDTPKDGDTVSSRPTLRWRPLSGAASYSVSVVATPTAISKEEGLGSSAYTCWSRSGLSSTSVTVDPEGFGRERTCDESRSGALISGRTYMWVVYARDSSGHITSSSEHYRLDHEPSFSVR